MENKKLINGLIKNIGKDSLYYIPGRIIPALIGFIGLWIYTRVYTPNEYGNYVLVTATVSMFSVFSYIWLNNANLRFFAAYRNDNKLERFFSTSFFSLVASITISLLAIFVLASLSLISGTLTDFILIIAGLLISTSFTETLMTILRTDRQAKYISLFRSLSAISSIAITLTLIFIFHTGIISILLGQFLADMTISVLIFFKFNFLRLLRIRYFSITAFKEFINYGSPFLILSLSAWALTLSNRFIINYYLGEADVGIYSAASQLGTYPIEMTSMMIILAAFPVIIDNWEKNGDESTKTLVPTIIKYYMLITIPIFFALFLLSPEVTALIGSKYEAGSSIIPWVSLAAICSGINMYTDIGLQLKKKTIFISIVMVISAISNIALNFLFVPLYGFYGSAISSALSQVIFLALTWAISQRYLPLKFPTGTFVKCVAASVVMYLLLALAKATVLPEVSMVSLVTLTVSGCICYFITIYALGELRTEVEAVKEMFAARKEIILLKSRV